MIATMNVNMVNNGTEVYPQIVSRMPVAERRAAVERLRELLPGFLWNDEFQGRNAAKKILTKPDDLPTNERKGRTSGGNDLTRYFGESARLPLLTPEEEVFYFRRMNFLRWRAEEALNGIDESRPSLKALRQIVADLQQGDADRNLLAEHNLRLVIPLAHRLHLRSESVWDYISEGNAALLRAIRGFDYGRGFRFSTYATWAIINSLQRLAGKQHRDSVRFMPTDGILFDAVEGDVESSTAEETRVVMARERIGSLLTVLDQRSRSVIAMRFGIGMKSEPKTLREIGEHLGVSKERVRQIEQTALHSMMAEEGRSAVMGA